MRVSDWMAAALACMACALLGYRAGERRAADNRIYAVQTDTVRYAVVDTVVIDRPVERTRWLSRTDTCLLATVEHDTVLVEVPIEARVYEDSLYRAQVSGYRPTLDWVEVYPRREVSVVRERIVAPDRRWSVGIQAGVGITPKGVQPYVGVGAAYRIY